MILERSTPMRKDDLMAMLEEDGVEPEALDETVIDCHCRRASAINNQGIEGQIGYLFHALSVAGILKRIGYCEHNFLEGRGCPECEALEHGDRQYHLAKDDGLW